MRGAQVFTQTLFPPERCKELSFKTSGRDADLIEQRNLLLLHRYYWHGTKEIAPGIRMSFESVIECLKKEFFLSERRITDIVEANADVIRSIRKAHMNMRPADIIRKFAKTWPHLTW